MVIVIISRRGALALIYSLPQGERDAIGLGHSNPRYWWPIFPKLPWSSPWWAGSLSERLEGVCSPC